jgi:hypothetical protein
VNVLMSWLVCWLAVLVCWYVSVWGCTVLWSVGIEVFVFRCVRGGACWCWVGILCVGVLLGFFCCVLSVGVIVCLCGGWLIHRYGVGAGVGVPGVLMCSRVRVFVWCASDHINTVNTVINNHQHSINTVINSKLRTNHQHVSPSTPAPKTSHQRNHQHITNPGEH